MTPRTTASPTIVRITSAPALPTDGALPLDVPADATPGSSGVRSSWKAGAFFFFALAAACFAVLAAGLAVPLAADAGAGWSNAIAAHAAAIRRMLVRTGGSRRESKAMTTSVARRSGLSVPEARFAESPIVSRGYSKMGRARADGAADTDDVCPRGSRGDTPTHAFFPLPVPCQVSLW